MTENPSSEKEREERAVVTLEALQSLIDVLAASDYQVLGPTVRDGAIVYDRIASVSDLPAGWTDRQEAGRYRLERRNDTALFGFAVGPQSWKRFLHPPIQKLWEARNTDEGLGAPAIRSRGEHGRMPNASRRWLASPGR